MNREAWEAAGQPVEVPCRCGRVAVAWPAEGVTECACQGAQNSGEEPRKGDKRCEEPS